MLLLGIDYEKEDIFQFVFQYLQRMRESLLQMYNFMIFFFFLICVCNFFVICLVTKKKNLMVEEEKATLNLTYNLSRVVLSDSSVYDN